MQHMCIAGVVSVARSEARGSRFDPSLALYFFFIREFCMAVIGGRLPKGRGRSHCMAVWHRGGQGTATAPINGGEASAHRKPGLQGH